MKTTTKLTNKKLDSLKNDNKLNNHVIDHIKDYTSETEERVHFINNVLRNGCVSGTVGGLIYYSDTTKFYQEFKEEIFELAAEQAEGMGYKNVFEFFKDLNGANDIGSIEQEENLKAWYGFEETLRIIANNLNLDI
jgi:hypothetical protein